MRRIGHLFAVALVAVFGGASCATTDWTAFGYDRRHFSKQPNESALTPATVGTLHQNFDFPAASATFTASPSVYNNVVYIGGLDGIFYAVYGTGASKGTLKWRYPPATATAADACGITTQALTLPPGQSGNPSGPGIASSAAIVSGVPGHTRAVIFGAPDPTSNNGDGRVWALDADTGACIWKSPVIAPSSGTSKIGYSSPAIAHDRAYIGVSARIPDNITIGKVFAVKVVDGTLDPAFNYSSAGLPAGGGMWSAPGITPSGNVVIVTGNSCRHWVPVSCPAGPTVPDYTNSLLKLDWQNGNVLWQVQPVHTDWDNDPDWAVAPIVGQVSCGSLAISVQKDGYLHAVDIKTGGPFSNPACSYTAHSLECPRWSFPSIASLPFQEDGHGDTRFLRPGALDGDRLYITTGGYNLTEMPPTDAFGQLPSGRIRLDRLYSLNVCAAPVDRIRWIFTSPAGSLGGVSTAKGIIYAGTDTSPSHLYALGDPTVVPQASTTCSYPNLPADPTCTAANFQFVPVPAIVKDISGLQGAIRGIPAISNGQVYVATTAGHIYGFVP
jgi:hypothetical protein